MASIVDGSDAPDRRPDLEGDAVVADHDDHERLVVEPGLAQARRGSAPTTWSVYCSLEEVPLLADRADPRAPREPDLLVGLRERRRPAGRAPAYDRPVRVPPPGLVGEHQVQEVEGRTLAGVERRR